MARIEWYAETNRKLNSSLTPNNRCTDKTTAINNYADPAPLANFEYNRLVPTSAGYVKLIEYIIRFLNWDGSVLQQVSVPRGTTPTYSGSTPSRTGYTWTGHWSPTDPVGATSATDYTATFEINTYTIRFLNYDGTVLQTKSVTYGTTPTYTGSTPTRTGYTWTGWSPTIVSASANVDYTATYGVNSYTVTYNNNVNSQSETRTVNYGDTAPAISPWSISGYTFDHWSKAWTTVTGNDTYTAYYTANPTYYTVTYTWTVPGGSSHTETESVQSGNTPSNVPSPESVTDYTGSWSSDPYSTTITGDITFTYTYTYNGPVGPVVSSAGPFMIQGGLSSYFPWNAGTTSYDDVQPFGFSIHKSGSANRSGRLTVTGYKYNYATGTKTNLPSGCYIDFQYVRQEQSNVEPPMIITLSDALYDEGWRLCHGDMYYANQYYQEPERAGNDQIWQGENSKTKAYINRKSVWIDNACIADSNYSSNSFLMIEGQSGSEGAYPLIGCPFNTPETIWVFNISSEDVNLSTHWGPWYPYITDSCYGSDNTYVTNAANLNDSNIPACYVDVSITARS